MSASFKSVSSNLEEVRRCDLTSTTHQRYHRTFAQNNDLVLLPNLFLLFCLIYNHRQPPSPLLTWILSGTPVLSMRLATFTVFPQMSYWGFLAPITPATTGPMLSPDRDMHKTFI